MGKTPIKPEPKPTAKLRAEVNLDDNSFYQTGVSIHVKAKPVPSNPSAWEEAGTPQGTQLYQASCSKCGAYVKSIGSTALQHFEQDHIH